MTISSGSSRRSIAIISLLVCLLAGLSVAAGRDPATASPHPVRTGLGRYLGADFVGFYVTRDGAKVYCLNPRKGAPATVSLRSVTRYPGLSAASSAALSYALATWGDARTRNAAAVESQVVNTLAGNHRDVARRNTSLPASLRRLVTRHVAQARSLRGPYRLRVATPAAPLPGGAATGRLTLVSAAGHAVPGVRVGLGSTANATVPAGVRTDRRGAATFRYTVRDVGEVRVTASATGLPGTAIRISDPRPGQQRLAGATARVAARSTATFRGSVSGFSHRYACTSDCAGRPTLTLSACAPASRVASRIVYRIGGRVLVSDFGASSRRRCATAVAIAPDGAVVTGAWLFRTTRGWSVPTAAGGTFTVDCPAPPVVSVSMIVDCTQSRVTASIPASTRRTVLVVTGAARVRVYAERGRATSWSSVAPCGRHDTLRFTSGAQRRDGSWNYARTASVVTA